MVSLDTFVQDYLIPYQPLKYFYDGLRGFIVWRVGTGLNAELLHIRTTEERKGYGRQLFYHMLGCLEAEGPPYYSVYGFTRITNHRALEFYASLGFDIQLLDGVYYDGEAAIFQQDFQVLLERMYDYEDRVRREA